MRTYRKHSLSAGRIVDGAAFVVTEGATQMHTLNETGTEIWALASEPFTAAEAVSVLVEKFDVDAETAGTDVADSLETFVREGILEEVQ